MYHFGFKGSKGLHMTFKGILEGQSNLKRTGWEGPGHHLFCPSFYQRRGPNEDGSLHFSKGGLRP